jgi:outer membrane immunogenic protein
MLRIFWISCLACSALTATDAFAADNKQSFNGPYVGGSIGYRKDKLVAHQVFNDGIISAETNTAITKGSGVSGGLIAGYNASLGSNIVLGLEVGFGLESGSSNYNLTADDIADFNASTDADITAASIGRKMQYTVDVAARLGFRPMDNLLVYGKLGYSSARGKLSGNYTTLAGKAKINTPYGRTYGGLLFGGGFEMMFSDNWSARLDYTHVKYEEILIPEYSGLDNRLGIKPKRDQISYAMAYHF